MCVYFPLVYRLARWSDRNFLVNFRSVDMGGYVYVCVRLCIYMCVCVYIHMHKYVYLFTHIDIHVKRYGFRHTNRTQACISLGVGTLMKMVKKRVTNI